MRQRRRPGGRLLKALLPGVALFALGIAAFAFWVVHTVAHPPTHDYLVTPAGYKSLSPRGLKATEETWANDDGTRARGWLLRGAEGSPAVVLLHAYGADRSWLLNLAVKLNEATNFTVLCPDLRGHGQSPTVATTTFGARESADATAALDFLRALKTPQQHTLVGKQFGLYGVELGAYAALRSAARAGDAAPINALALDSVPARPDELLRGLMRDRVGFGSGALFQLARAGSRLYFLGKYEDAPACEAASSLGGRRVLLLSGADAGTLRDSTRELAKCFPGAGAVELKADLPVTGLHASSATGEAGEAYDRLVIDFFQQSLR